MLGWLFQKLFIAIVPYEGSYDVTVVAYKSKKKLNRLNRRFEGGNAQEEMFAFVRKQAEDTPLHYIALLNPDPNQGALEGCSIHDINEVEEISGAKTLCRNQKWVIYTSLRELDALKKRYGKIGLDFVFSPFSVLENFFADKISGKLAVYALAQKDSLSIAFFEEGKLNYAYHYPFHTRESSELEEEGSGIGFSLGVEEVEEPTSPKGIRLDDIESLDELDIIDELDDLSDIEDLDAIEDIAEFSEDEPTFEEKRTALPQSMEIKEELDRFNNDFRRFELIQKTLSRFYAGEHCRNRFVESIYVADGYGSGAELKRYLEEELFLGVTIRKIDLGDEVISLAIMEEGGK